MFSICAISICVLFISPPSNGASRMVLHAPVILSEDENSAFEHVKINVFLADSIAGPGKTKKKKGGGRMSTSADRSSASLAVPACGGDGCNNCAPVRPLPRPISSPPPSLSRASERGAHTHTHKRSQTWLLSVPLR